MWEKETQAHSIARFTELFGIIVRSSLAHILHSLLGLHGLGPVGPFLEVILDILHATHVQGIGILPQASLFQSRQNT